jgi:hypothetical protein
MIKGTYIFYQDGKEIARHSNIITKFGKRFLTNFVAGNVISSKKDMAFGVGSGIAISNISGNGTAITFTTATAHGLAAGNKISIVGVVPTAYNLSNATVATTPSTTTFTISNSTSTAYTSGGYIVSDVNTRLDFEFYRLPVLFGSTDIQTSNGVTTYSVIYKSTIPQDIVGNIYEVALYPSTRSSVNNFDSKYLTGFDDSLDWEDSSGINPSVDSTNYRIGGNVLRMSASASTSKEYKSSIPTVDLSGYSEADTIKLAYYREDSNLSSIKIRLYSDATKYYEATVTPSSGTGYKLSSDIPLSTFFAGATSPSPDIANINQIGIVVTAGAGGTTYVGMDGLRINDEDTFDPVFGMISRSVFATPITKTSGRQVDVEYRLDLGF